MSGHRARTPLFLAVCTLILYAPLLFADQAYVLSDYLGFTVPSRQYLASRLVAFEWPGWFRGAGLGHPFASDPIHGAGYPIFWLTSFLPERLATDLPHVLHAFWGAWGVSALSRRFGAAPVPAFFAGAWFLGAGYFGSMFCMGVPFLTMAWTPWIACLSWDFSTAYGPRPFRATWLLLAAAVALQIAAGDPAGVITSSWLAFFILCARRPGWRRVAAWAFALAFAVFLAALTIVPAIAVLEESARAHGIAKEVASGWSMHPVRLLQFVWPHVFGVAADPELTLGKALFYTGDGFNPASWALTLHVGLLPLLLGAWALKARHPRTRFVGWMALFFVLLALGRFTPFYGAYRTLFPLEWVIRYPERHIAGFCVLAYALAGVGLTHVAHRLRPGMARFFLIPSAILAVLASALVIGKSAWLSWLAPKTNRVDLETIWSMAVASGFAAAALAPLMILFARRGLRMPPRARHSFVTIATGMVTLVFLFIDHWSNQIWVPRDLMKGTPLMVEFAKKDSPRPRIARDKGPAAISTYSRTQAEAYVAHFHTGSGNRFTQYGADVFPGYQPAAESPRVTDLWAQSRKNPSRHLAVLSRYAITHALFPTKVPTPPGLEDATGNLWGVKLLKVSSSRPRGYVTANWKPVASFERAMGGVFTDAGTTFVETDIDKAAPEDSGPALTPCTVSDPSPESVQMVCDVTKPGVAVLQDANRRGWSARVDGKPAPIFFADGLVRAVFIDAPGRHTIDFVYAPPGLIAGAALAITAWALWTLAWIVPLRRRARGGARSAV
jgi:hypothetical protein